MVTYSDNKTVCIYKNGTLIRTGSQPSWNTIGNILTIGSKAGGIPNNIYGHLDDFEIYNTTLSQVQVSSLYSNGTALLSNHEFNKQKLQASIYPNPTTDSFSIEMENDLKSVEIYSLQGQKVMTSFDKNVNISNLSNGMYLVRIEDKNNNVNTQKLIVK